ncbi:hypothetical protein G7085_08450 [Tessaracoccus sp. HDW20]|uniref:hypothetical protein n=1 Tax=Tessaracoccus coleopterorum TaxID=2714950 RepID=UPI0018D31F3A|nr:hypothetical protein [Tessaracoccus coleopterorum]NHB84626.1 hypothetical protein [Tessaracoccus coleopterorum]
MLTQAAINAVDPPAEPGQFWLISTTSTGVAEYSDPDQESGECAYKTIDLTYVSVTGESPSWFVSSAAEVASNQQPCVDSSSLRSDTFTNDIIPNQRPASWQHPSPAFLASLPRDVTQLRERLYEDSRGHGQDAHSEVFVYVADVLRSGLVPADLRSSLFGVLKSLPGIEVSEESVDAGRDVVVLGIGDAGEPTA